MHETLDTGHGRIECRRIETTTALNAYIDFPHARQIARVQREVTRAGRTTTETAWLITSLAPEHADAERLLALNRGHWAIENRLHWVRDVTFDEDRCQARTGAGPQVLACLRNVAIALVRRLIRGRRTSIASALRHLAACPRQAIAALVP